MRLCNFCLHLAVTGLLFWAASLDAQQNGNLSTVRQSTGDLLANGNPWQNGVLNGDMVVGAACWESASSSGVACSACTDTNGVIPAITVGTLSQNNGLCSGDVTFHPECNSQMFWGKATSTGAPAISCTCTFPRQATFTWMELTQGSNLAFDAQATTNSNSANPSVAVTSTQQNDVVVATDCNGTPNGTPTLTVTDPSQQFASHSTVGDIDAHLQFFRTASSGTQTALFQSIATPAALNVVAFKPTALTIGASKLPDGGNGIAYDAKLVAWGGTGSYTWSITVGSLQSGLSLNTSTGEISGTPTSTSNNNITFHVTDGTNSGNLATTLNISSTLQTIGTPSCAGFSTQPGTASVPVRQGDAVLLCYKGDSRHGTTGYLTVLLDIGDNFGNTYFRANPIPGSKSGGLQCDSTTSVASGLLTPSYASLGGSPLAGMICDVPGAQQIVDDLVVNTEAPGAVSSPITLTSSITSTVPNTTILSMSMLDCLATGGSSCTMTTSTNSPFGLVASVSGFGGTPFAVYSQQAPTATSYSATWNFSDSTSSNMALDTPIGALIVLRPAVPSSTPTAGEKVRRYVN